MSDLWAVRSIAVYFFFFDHLTMTTVHVSDKNVSFLMINCNIRWCDDYEGL